MLRPVYRSRGQFSVRADLDKLLDGDGAVSIPDLHDADAGSRVAALCARAIERRVLIEPFDVELDVVGDDADPASASALVVAVRPRGDFSFKMVAPPRTIDTFLGADVGPTPDRDRARQLLLRVADAGNVLLRRAKANRFAVELDGAEVDTLSTVVLGTLRGEPVEKHAVGERRLGRCLAALGKARPCAY